MDHHPRVVHAVHHELSFWSNVPADAHREVIQGGVEHIIFGIQGQAEGLLEVFTEDLHHRQNVVATRCLYSLQGLRVVKSRNPCGKCFNQRGKTCFIPHFVP